MPWPAAFRPSCGRWPGSAALLQVEFGRVYSTAHVWRLPRGLGCSSPRPTGRAIQCDEPAILQWKQLRWPAHRSRLVRQHVDSHGGRIVLERLPPYAPELNPVEHLFGDAKQRELANLCLHAIDDVRRYASGRIKAMQAMQRRPRLITAFWQQAERPL